MLSDLYALGVVNCDNMLMLLGVSQKLTEHERDIVVPLIMQGFMVSAIACISCLFSHVTANFARFGFICVHFDVY